MTEPMATTLEEACQIFNLKAKEFVTADKYDGMDAHRCVVALVGIGIWSFSQHIRTHGGKHALTIGLFMVPWTVTLIRFASVF
jgi:hypothetical protein